MAGADESLSRRRRMRLLDHHDMICFRHLPEMLNTSINVLSSARLSPSGRSKKRKDGLKSISNPQTHRKEEEPKK